MLNLSVQETDNGFILFVSNGEQDSTTVHGSVDDLFVTISHVLGIKLKLLQDL